MRQTARNEAVRIYMSRLRASLRKVANVAFLDTFQTGFESAKNRLKAEPI